MIPVLNSLVLFRGVNLTKALKTVCQLAMKLTHCFSFRNAFFGQLMSKLAGELAQYAEVELSNSLLKVRDNFLPNHVPIPRQMEVDGIKDIIYFR